KESINTSSESSSSEEFNSDHASPEKKVDPGKIICTKRKSDNKAKPRSVYLKNLMDRKDALLNYFDTVDDSNLTVVVHPTTPKFPLTNNTPTSFTTATGNETLTLADEIKKYDTGALISFLQERGLELDLDDENIICKEKITGQDLFDLTEERLRSVGLGLGPAMRLVKFAKECKNKKLRAFSSYRSLKEVLAEYDLASEGTEIIPLFTPRIRKIPDENKHLELCMADIKLRLKSYEILVMTSLESMRNEYVSTILHTALHIAEDITKKKFSMRSEYEIIGDESSGQVDYVIKTYRNPMSLFASQRIRSSKN
ncbi:3460_t:CDS:2, partial [Funneliformis caledonium]